MVKYTETVNDCISIGNHGFISAFILFGHKSRGPEMSLYFTNKAQECFN